MSSLENYTPALVGLASTEVNTNIADCDVDRRQLLVSPSLREGSKKGSEFPFPVKLHFMLNDLEKQGLDDIISWLPDGKGFIIYKPTEAAKYVLPHWFRQNSYGSFQRQLNLYCFKRIKYGNMKGGYHHRDLFVRGKPLLSYRIKREPVKSARRRNDIDRGNDRSKPTPWMGSKTSYSLVVSSSLMSSVALPSLKDTPTRPRSVFHTPEEPLNFLCLRLEWETNTKGPDDIY